MKNEPSQITEGVIWKQLLAFFFPILLGTFFQQMYNTVDTIIVGRFVGTQALAAVGTTTPLVNMTTGFFVGLSTGAAVVLSQYFGAKSYDRVKKSLHTAMALSVVLGLVITIFGLLAGPAILHAIKTPESCMAGASTYIRIYFLGAVASMFYNMGAGILRAMGDSKRPLYFLIISCSVNIILDVLFVVILKMGIAGAAIATVLSQISSGLMVVLVLIRLPESYRLHFREMKINGIYLKYMLQVGIPSGLQYVTFDLANLLVQSGINSFGEATVAAWAANTKTDAIIWMIIGAFGVAVTTFVGQNYGARKFKRIKQSIWTCLGMSMLVICSISALMIIFRVPILKIYINDPEVIFIGARALLLIAPWYWLFLPVEIMGGAMRGVGYSVVPTVITISFACVARVLWIMFVLPRWHTLEVLALTYPISWASAALVFLIVYFRGKWFHDAKIRAELDDRR